MSSISMSSIKLKHIVQLLASGKRLDGRGQYDYREIQIESGAIERAEGSARVKLGKTEVITGIKIGIGSPYSDRPNEGVLTVNAELVPLASPKFEPGPPTEAAIELARVVDRGIRESQAIDLEKLCIIPGNKVFIVFFDVYVLNHDGNLIDASAISALAALLNAKLFNYEVNNEEVKIKPGFTQLPIRNYPIAITFANINGKLVIDPWLEEEQVMKGRLTITFEKDGHICAMQKGERGTISVQKILEAAKIGQTKAETIRKLLVKK